MLNPYQVIHVYFKIVLPYQGYSNKYFINCQAPKYSFFALNNIKKASYPVPEIKIQPV